MRALGFGLILYGMLGLVLVGAAWVVMVGTADRVERLTANVEGSLQAAAVSVQHASDSFEGFETSLAEADAAAQSAATVVRESSVTMASLAGAMSVSIFGTQPLLPLSRDFERVAQQLTVLAADLDRMSAALLANRGDVDTIRGDLAILGAHLEELTGSGLGGGEPAEEPPLRALAIGFLVWLGLQAAGSVLAGAAILRRALRPPPAAVIVEPEATRDPALR